ncbi:hypothetical protein [Prevotella sp. HUN102]|uniref:hypothetical protein n=1 Tax=Prevotella sp. HUN102 TaxID=1392486 RepID=UPI00048B6DE7|nr:hypothetical protein [Prevotella sp. HUN102]
MEDNKNKKNGLKWIVGIAILTLVGGGIFFATQAPEGAQPTEEGLTEEEIGEEPVSNGDSTAVTNEISMEQAGGK